MSASRVFWKLSSVVAMTGVAAASLALIDENEAAAQEKVEPTAKGAIGGALLGAEAVMITESLIGVKPWWAYAVGGGLGAIGGGIGGYFIETAVDDGRIPVFMLAGGLALVIPTLVLTLNATRYQPSDVATEDRAPTNEPKADPGKAGGSVSEPAPASAPAGGGAGTPPATTAPATGTGTGGAPTSLMDVRGGSFRLALPVPEVRPVFSTAERRQFGMRNETEVRLPVFKVTF